MIRVSEGKRALENKPSGLDASLLPLCNEATHSLEDAIAAMTKVRVQDSFPCNEKRLAPLGPYPMNCTLPPANAASLISSKERANHLSNAFDYQLT
jgi:hypothetical protein